VLNFPEVRVQYLTRKVSVMTRACSTHGKIRNTYNILVGEPEVTKPLGRQRRAWEDNIKVDQNIV
jgi:hypothetical protein